MTGPRLLCLSNPMGLGHITRDLAVIRALRKLIPQLEATWLTAEPNVSILREAGETVHPSSSMMQSPTEAAENSAQGSFRYESRHIYNDMRLIQKKNAKILSSVLEGVKPDLVFGDEAAEVLWVLAENPAAKRWPLVLLTDALYPSVGEPPGGLNLIKRWRAYRYRGKYVRSFETFKNSGFEPYLMLYVGTSSDVPDTRMGFRLPRLRDFYLQHFRPIGYILPFDPNVFRREDKSSLKYRLGYAPKKKLIIASVGGIGIGKEFFASIDAAASELVKVAKGALEIVFICGPRLPIDSVKVSSSIIKVRGYVPQLYEHFAAADFAIIKAGLSSAVELAALGTPFVYVPIPGSVEEELEVAPRLKRLGVGQLVKLSDLTPANLANAFGDALTSPSKSLDVEIPTHGAEVAAKLIRDLLLESPNYQSIDGMPYSPTLRTSSVNEPEKSV